MNGLTMEYEALDKLAKEFGGESEEALLPRKSSKIARPNDSKSLKEAPRPKKKVLEPSSDIEAPFTLRLWVELYTSFRHMLISI